jgi:2-C-methyl-D-erythritol 4-phosphate cytidylyltransferase
MIVAAVLVAAGSGARLGADVPKAFVEVNDQPLLEYAVQRFLVHRAVRDVVVVVPVGWTEQANEMLDELVKSFRSVDELLGKLGRPPAGPTMKPLVVAGGSTRQESVERGLAVLADDVDAVLVHDVARAFVPAAVISRVVDALEAGADAVVPTVPLTDTLRSVGPDGLGPTVDRTGLVAVQTPQGFRRQVLDAAHSSAPGGAATDDASLVEADGVRVVAVPGASEAFKVTVPLDLALAEVVADRV